MKDPSPSVEAQNTTENVSKSNETNDIQAVDNSVAVKQQSATTSKFSDFSTQPIETANADVSMMMIATNISLTSELALDSTDTATTKKIEISAIEYKIETT